MNFDSLRYKHNNERCFILGCAPSLAKENLKLINQDIVMTINKGFLAKDLLESKKIDYYFLGDAYVYKELIENYKNEFDKINCPRFYSSKIKEILEIDIPEDYINIPKTYADENSVERKGFPVNFDGGWGATRGTVFDATITAYFMGFKEIYWLGVDYDYSDKQNTHFYGTGDREQKLIHDIFKFKNGEVTWRRQRNTIKIISEHLKNNGVVLKNLSKGFKHQGLMEVSTLESVVGDLK